MAWGHRELKLVVWVLWIGRPLGSQEVDRGQCPQGGLWSVGRHKSFVYCQLFYQVVQSLSCIQLFVTSWTYSVPSFPVLHHLPEFAQTHIHWVDDAIQPFHLLSSLSPPPHTLSEHRSLLQWVSSSYQVPKVLELQLQHQSFWWLISFRTDWFDLLQSKGLSRVFSCTTIQKHQFFGAQVVMVWYVYLFKFW